MSNKTKTDKLAKTYLMTDNFWDKAAISDVGEPKFAVNVQDKAHSYKLEVAAPGFKKKDFNILVANGFLKITAKNKKSAQAEKLNYIRKEFSTASFSGSFKLPEHIQENHIRAKYQNGLFIVKLKKTEIEVNQKKKQVKIN
jgi:HSP20 family protein